MGRRRRSLIAGTSRSRRPGEGADTPEDLEPPTEEASVPPEDASVAPDDASAAPDDASAAPDDASAAPDDASAAPDEASAAPDDVHDDELPHREVAEEPVYVPAGAGMIEDTTDSGWHETAQPSPGEPLPPPAPGPTSRRSDPPTSRRSDPPRFREDEAPTQRAGSSWGSGDRTPGFTPLPDFDDEGSPPTDEVPSAVLQDVSQPYAAPMSVPEPPPIPGIFDRFTPAAAQPRGSKAPTNRPSYIAATPTPPPALRRVESPDPALRRVKRDPAPAGRGPGWPLVLALLGIGGVATLALAAALLWVGSQGPGSAPTTGDAGSATELEGPTGLKVKVQQGLRPGETPPAPGGEAPVPEPDPAEPAPPEPTQAAPAPRAPLDRPAPRPQAPRPAPAAEAPPVEPAQGLGTLQIRSNRRVLIYVDGKALGYSPQTYLAEPGARTVSAMLPGQPQSKQTQTVSLSAGGTAPIQFSF